MIKTLFFTTLLKALNLNNKINQWNFTTCLNNSLPHNFYGPWKNRHLYFTIFNKYHNSDGNISSNNLSLDKGEYKYLHNVNLDFKFKWKSGNYNHNELGRYDNNATLENNSHKLISNLSLIQSYSILFNINTNENLKNINRQLLINHDTSVLKILKFLLIKIDLMCYNYNITYGNKIGYKIKPLYVKLENPIIDKSLMSKFFYNKYISYTRNLGFYGIIINKKGNNKISFHYNNSYKLIVNIIDQDKH